MAKITHSMIGDTAKAIAFEAYESVAHDNLFYAEWPSAALFVRKNWHMFIDQARAALTQILSGDYPDAMKQPIYEALLMDGSSKRDPTANRATRRKTASMGVH